MLKKGKTKPLKRSTGPKKGIFAQIWLNKAVIKAIITVPPRTFPNNRNEIEIMGTNC